MTRNSTEPVIKKTQTMPGASAVQAVLACAGMQSFQKVVTTSTIALFIRSYTWSRRKKLVVPGGRSYLKGVHPIQYIQPRLSKNFLMLPLTSSIIAHSFSVSFLLLSFFVFLCQAWGVSSYPFLTHTCNIPCSPMAYHTLLQTTIIKTFSFGLTFDWYYSRALLLRILWLQSSFPCPSSKVIHSPHSVPPHLAIASAPMKRTPLVYISLPSVKVIPILIHNI